MGLKWFWDDEKSVLFGEFSLWHVSTVSIWNVRGDWLMSLGKFLLQVLPQGGSGTPVPAASGFGGYDCLASALLFAGLLCPFLLGCLFDLLPLLGFSKLLLAAFMNLLILVWEGHSGCPNSWGLWYSNLSTGWICEVLPLFFFLCGLEKVALCTMFQWSWNGCFYVGVSVVWRYWGQVDQHSCQLMRALCTGLCWCGAVG